MIRKYYLCNECAIRNCKKKPPAVSSFKSCPAFKSPESGWTILELIMGNQPKETLEFLYNFGLGVKYDKETGFKLKVLQ